MKNLVFFVESNGKDPICNVCGGNLKYRDRVPRIMKKYNGESPSLRTAVRWKQWIEKNRVNINGYLKAIGHSILGLSTQFLKSDISLLDELRKDGGGWLASIQLIIYNAGGFLEPFY